MTLYNASQQGMKKKLHSSAFFRAGELISLLFSLLYQHWIKIYHAKQASDKLKALSHALDAFMLVLSLGQCLDSRLHRPTHSAVDSGKRLSY